MKTAARGSCRRLRPSVLGEFTRQQHLRPLTPGLSRRPCSVRRHSDFRQCRSGLAGAVAVAGSPGRTQTSFRLPQDLLPSPVWGWRYVDIRPTGGGGWAPSRPEENFATAICFLMEWCVKSLRTDGLADDRTRWPKRRRGCTAWVNHEASACVGLPWRITPWENMAPR